MRKEYLAIVGLCFAASGVQAQAPAPSGKTLAATMNVYVFPTNGQTPTQQSQDEGECYNWA